MELFATKVDHRLLLSPMYDPVAWAVDALTLDWDLLFGYTFPPFVLIPIMLQKTPSLSAVPIVLLIAPFWHWRYWFKDLPSCLADVPRSILIRKYSVRAAGSAFSCQPGYATYSRLDLRKLPLVSMNLDGCPLESSLMLSGQS